MNDPAIIFDMDGTLVDSAADILLALHMAFEQNRVTAPPDLNESWIGPPIREILNRFPDRLSDELREAVVRSFRSNYDSSDFSQTTPYPGTKNTLDRLELGGGADMSAATGLGCHAVGVGFGYGDRGELLRAGASGLLENFKDLEKEIQKP